MQEKVRDVVLKVLSEHCDRKVISTEEKVFDSLGLSSLEMMMTIIEIESQLKITLDYSKLFGIQTVQQLVDAIVALCIREESKK